MKKGQWLGITGLLLSVLLILSALAGCGASNSTGSGNMSAATVGAAAPGAPEVQATDKALADGQTKGSSEGATEQPANGSGASADSLVGGTNISQEMGNAALAERKMIWSANVTTEVDNFDEAYNKINNLLLGIGFIQQTNIDSERVLVDGSEKLLKKGTIVLRVDKDQFVNVFNKVKGIGRVTNYGSTGNDVTDKYIDVESRLRLLKLEEGKLESYISKLTDMDQIFKAESRMTEIRQEIESLTVNLKKMDDLVQLSTITINISEKYPESIDPKKPVTYGQRLLNNLTGSLKGVANFCGELVIVLVAALPVLVFLGILALIVLLIVRWISRMRKRHEGPVARRDGNLGNSSPGSGSGPSNQTGNGSEKNGNG